MAGQNGAEKTAIALAPTETRLTQADVPGMPGNPSASNNDTTQSPKPPETSDERDFAGTEAAVGDITDEVEEDLAAIPEIAVFDPANRSSLTEKLGLVVSERPHRIERPQKRHASYLIVDNGTVNNTTNHEALRNEINLISGSEDFYATEDTNGNLIIISLSEREGLEKLVAIQKSIGREIPEAKMLLDISKLERKRGQPNFQIYNYPSGDQEAFWKKGSPGSNYKTMISKRLFEAKQAPGTRIGKNISFKVEESEDPNFLYLIYSIAEVAEERGGPDRRIGYDAEFKRLQGYCGDRESRVVILEGKAWQGKSRLRTELCEKLNSYILCSGNPGDVNDLGSSLASLADQLKTAITKETNKTDPEIAAITDETANATETVAEPSLTLASFAKLNETDQKNFAIENPTATSKLCLEYTDLERPQQIALARKNPQLIKNICLAALLTLNHSKDPNTVLILEDLHHFDRLSLPFMLQMADEYLDHTEGTFLPIRRPEEMYQSMDFTEFLAKRREKSGADSVKTVSLERGLEFVVNPQLAYDFAYYSLPPDIREGRTLTGWQDVIASKVANSPGYFKNIMDAVKEQDDEGRFINLIITSETISLTPEFLEKLERMNPENPSDITSFLYERIAKLPELSRTILEITALLEEGIAPFILIEIAQNLGVFDGVPEDQYSQKISEICDAVIHKGYLREKNVANSIWYEFDHESMRHLVLEAIPTDRKRKLAGILDKITKDSSLVTLESKHSTATILADGETDARFWTRYKKLSEMLIHQADQQHDNEHLYAIAGRTLSSQKIQNWIGMLERREGRVPETIEKLIVKALTTKADAARFLGKFEEVKALVAQLKTIHLNNPGAVNILEVHLIDFERAYLESKTDEMQAIMDEIERCGMEAFHVAKAMMEIKMAYKKNDFERVTEIYNANRSMLEAINKAHEKAKGHPLPVFLETKRVAMARCPFEAIRVGAEKRDGVIKFDSDVVHQPNALNSRQRARLELVSQELNTLEAERRRNPLCFDHYEEFALMDERAEITAFMGDTVEAIKLYGECWLLATQMKVHDRATRAARMKGDLVLQVALGEESPSTKAALIKKAIAIYSNEGIQSSDKISGNNFYKFLIRGQRIRSIAALAYTYKDFSSKPDNPISREELETQIAVAIEDFTLLNRDFADYGTDPEVAYCILGAMGHIVELATELDITLPENLFDTTTYPYLNFAMLEPAKDFGGKMTDFGFGEVERKMEGLEKLRKISDHQKHEKLKRERLEAIETPNHQLLARMHRFQGTGELARNWAKLHQRPDRTRIGMHFETAVTDYKFLTSQDFLRQFPDQARNLAASFHDICEAAAALSFDLSSYFRAEALNNTITPERLERDIELVIDLNRFAIENLYKREKAERSQRDLRLASNQ